MIREIKDKDLDSIVNKGFHMVDLYGTFCVPCKQLSKTLEEIEKEVPQLSVLKINTDQNRDVISRFDVMSVPTILFYKDGEIVDKKIGLISREEIFDIAREYMY